MYVVCNMETGCAVVSVNLNITRIAIQNSLNLANLTLESTAGYGNKVRNPTQMINVQNLPTQKHSKHTSIIWLWQPTQCCMVMTNNKNNVQFLFNQPIFLELIQYSQLLKTEPLHIVAETLYSQMHSLLPAYSTRTMWRSTGLHRLWAL